MKLFLIIFQLIVLITIPFACKSKPAEQPQTTTETTPQPQEAAAAPKTGDESPDRVVAKVNGKDLTLGQLDDRVGGLVGKFKEINPNIKFPQEKLTNLRTNFLDRMIKDMILLEECDRRNITVTDDEIKSRTDQLKNIFGQTADAQKYFEDGVKDWGKFSDEIKKQARIQKLYDVISGDEVTATDAEIETYFKENPDKFQVPEQVRARQILIKLEQSPKATPSNEEKEAALKKIKDIQARLKAGEAFDKLATELSEDPATASKGGDMGLFPRNRMPKPVEEAAFSLPVGEMSDIIESKRGYHIIKVEEKKEPYNMTFDEVKERISKNLIREKKSKIQQEFVDNLMKNAKIEKLL